VTGGRREESNRGAESGKFANGFSHSSNATSRPQWLKPNSGFKVLVQFARMTCQPELPDRSRARGLLEHKCSGVHETGSTSHNRKRRTGLTERLVV
jgi:hypothetical protein